MNTEVKYFDSTMSGAPSLSGTAGALIGVLDACLVDGFGSVTVDSLVVASDVATATVSAGHQFTMQGNTGPVIRIAGASPSGLNGNWRVTVTSGTVFTFATSGIGDQTATGTITAKRAPAGFSKAFSGTDKAVYRSDDIAGSRLFFRIDDTSAQVSQIVVYESMTGVDTGTDGTPIVYFHKSDTASSSVRSWRLYVDSRAFYLFSQPRNDGWYEDLSFGDFLPFYEPDAYACFLIGSADSASGEWYNGNLSLILNNAGSYLSRDYDASPGYVAFKRYGHRLFTNYLGSNGANYPNPSGTQLLCSPVEVWSDAVNNCRGLMPGLYGTVHSYSSMSDGAILGPINAQDERVKIQRMGGSVSGRFGCAAISISGPWR